MVDAKQKEPGQNQSAPNPEAMLKAMADAFLMPYRVNAATALEDTQKALSAAADSLFESGRLEVAETTKATAEKLEGCAAGMLRGDGHQLLEKFKHQAGQHPWVYVGGAALVGAALCQGFRPGREAQPETSRQE